MRDMLGVSRRNRVVTLWPHADRFSVARGGPGGLCVGGEACPGLKKKLVSHFRHFLKFTAPFSLCPNLLDGTEIQEVLLGLSPETFLL